MIRIDVQVSKEEGLTTWLVASTVWLYRHEDSVNLLKRVRVIKLENPAFLSRVVLIKNSQIHCLFLSGPRLPHAWNVLAVFTPTS